MRDGRDLHGREVVVSKASELGFSPCEGLLVEFEDVGRKLDLFWQQETVLVDVELVVALLGEAQAGRERWGVGRKRR